MEQLLPYLQLPERCLLKTRLTKAFFKRNFDLTTAEKTLLDDFNSVKAMEWIASIAPANANIPLFKEGLELYEEVEFICVQTGREGFEKRSWKIAELVQKYIPYPVLLCIYHEEAFILNACDKRINQNDSQRRTLEKMYFTESIPGHNQNKQQQDFLNSLTFAELDKTNLKTYYQAYVQRIVALQAAEVVGEFTPRPQYRTQNDVERLEQIEVLTGKINTLRSAIRRAGTLNERVQLNMQLQQLNQKLKDLKAELSEPEV